MLHERAVPASVEPFPDGSDHDVEVLRTSATDTIAYWVGLRHANVHLGGSSKTMQMTRQVAEVFLRDADGWKLVYRRVDAWTPTLAPTIKEISGGSP